MATVTVSSLQCDETYDMTYDITAGGIFSTEVMGQTLDGPRFHTETVSSTSCTMISTTTLPSKEVLLYILILLQISFILNNLLSNCCMYYCTVCQQKKI